MAEKNLPQKPNDAVWNAADSEWELGQKNSQGQYIGEWMWWLAPTNHLCCHSFFDDNGTMLSYTRYHIDGTYSQKGSYINGKQHGTFYYQASENETTENCIPPEAPEGTFRMTYEYDNGQFVSAQFFTIDGEEMDRYGNLINPKRAASIPDDAYWNDVPQLWEKGNYSDGNQKTGIWTYWHANGNKAVEEIYENKIIKEVYTFHPDGTHASIDKYNTHSFSVYRCTIDSENETHHDFPSGLAEGTFKLEYYFDDHGYMINWRGLTKEGNVIENHNMNLSLDNTVQQTHFDSLAEASKIWNEKGAEYYTEINRWLGQFYDENSEVSEDEPEPIDDRGDMEKTVLYAIEKLNKDGEPEKARALFAPSYDAIDKHVWGHFGKSVQKIVIIDTESFLARIENKVYYINNNSITMQQDIIAFGASKDKKYIATANKKNIVVTLGWNGDNVATFSYPQNFGSACNEAYPNLFTDSFESAEKLGIQEIKVFANGKKLLLIATEGVYIIEENNTNLIYPHYDKLAEMIENFSSRVSGNLADYIFTLSLSYVNADISFDEAYVAVGGKIPSPVHAGSCIYKNEGQHWELVKYAQEDAMFSIQNQFHPNGKDMLHAACLYASIGTNWSDTMPNTTFRMDIASLTDGKFELDNFAGGYRQAVGVVLATAPLGDGFLLGASDGYIWWCGDNAELKGYLHVGGNITSIDIALDQKYMVAATSQGQIVKYNMVDERGKGIITNMNVKDARRYIFFKTFEPMIW